MADIVNDITLTAGDIAIDAGAGTGKTYTLVEKVLAELRLPDGEKLTHVDRIAAITFTDKAAEEMRERIRERLTEEIETLREEMEGTINAGNLLEKPDKDSLAKDRLLEHFLVQRQSISGADISTIHAYCGSLLREHAVIAGLDPAFIIIEERRSKKLLREAVKETLLTRLRRGEKDVFIFTLAMGFEMRGVKFGTGGLVDVIVKMIPLLRAGATSTAEMKKEIKTELAELDNSKAGDFCAFDALADEIGNAASRMKSVVRDIRPVDSMPRDNTKIDIKTACEIYRIAQSVKPKRKSTKTDPLRLKISDALIACSAPIIERESLKETLMFVDIIESCLDRYGKIKELFSFVDFDDLQERVYRLLKTDKYVRGLYQKKIKRLLVDEFQDINELQKRIIELIAPVGSGRLFMVGDIKQSIYRFRGADCSIMEKGVEQIKKAGGNRFTLAISRRSTPELIKFTNAFFKRAMGKEFDDDRDTLKPLSDPDDAGVKVVRYRCPTGRYDAQGRRLAEADGVAEYISGLIHGGATVSDRKGGRRPVKYGDIAILFRKLKYINKFSTALTLRAIANSIVKGTGFFRTTEIMDITTALNLLLNPADRLLFYTILRSPFVGLTDSSLLAIYQATGNLGESLMYDKKIELPDAEMLKFSVFSRDFLIWQDLLYKITLPELIEKIVSDTGYLAVMTARGNGETRLANIFKLIELAREYHSDPNLAMNDFVLFLTEGIENEEEEATADSVEPEGDQVTLMSVHKAKGLEFPVVIIADIAFENKTNTDHLIEYRGLGLGLGIRYYDRDVGDFIKGEKYQRIAGQIKIEETKEELRILYVAMTRAREILVLAGPSTEQYSKGVWNKIIDETIVEAGLDVNLVEYEPKNTGHLSEEIDKEDEVCFKKAKLVRPTAAGIPARPAGLPKPESLLAVSVTDLAMFQFCPRYFYLNRRAFIDGKKPNVPENILSGKNTSSAFLGSLVHLLLKSVAGRENHTRLAEKYSETLLKGLKPALANEVKNDVITALNRKPLLALGCAEMILREEPVSFGIKTDNGLKLPKITGIADLIWIDEDGLSVADYKYAVKSDSLNMHKFQVKAYSLIFMRAFNIDSATAHLIYLKNGSVDPVSIKIDKAGLLKIEHEIENGLREMINLGDPVIETSEPAFLRRDNNCTYITCRHAKACREGF